MQSFERLLIAASEAKHPIDILCLTKQGWASHARHLAAAEKKAAAAQNFAAEPGQQAILAGGEGRLEQVLFGMGEKANPPDPFLPGKLARTLGSGTYRLSGEVGNERLAALGWLLESYDFDRYRQMAGASASLVCPQGIDRENILAQASAVKLTRDLINTPASDLGPAELEQAARKLARQFHCRIKVVTGKALRDGFPMIDSVGRASPRAPRLIDFSWGGSGPRITLVGKGVCFDTGGLDIKPSQAMLIMKKDMGGAANVLGLAQLIMQAALPIRLRVLIPAVENSISGTAFRPGDVLKSRRGLTVEIGNTDAEGRLILAEALALADEEAPDLLVDMATLTGAARVALGPDLPALFTADKKFAEELFRLGETENDQVWHMPLWSPYERLFESRIADLNNASESPFAGSITAALFLQHFVQKAKIFAHFDIYAWTPAQRPGRPFGGEAQAIRALFAWLAAKSAR